MINNLRPNQHCHTPKIRTAVIVTESKWKKIYN